MSTVNDDGIFLLSRRGSRGTLLVAHRHHRAPQGVCAGAHADAAAGAGE
ncbi:hypothetical protein OG588_20615 [Streptomyces prunicolor]|nr:hypothetical protein OG588_20615 [Streptomyces prunicolor]